MLRYAQHSGLRPPCFATLRPLILRSVRALRALTTLYCTHYEDFVLFVRYFSFIIVLQGLLFVATHVRAIRTPLSCLTIGLFGNLQVASSIGCSTKKKQKEVAYIGGYSTRLGTLQAYYIAGDWLVRRLRLTNHQLLAYIQVSTTISPLFTHISLYMWYINSKISPICSKWW